MVFCVFGFLLVFTMCRLFTRILFFVVFWFSFFGFLKVFTMCRVFSCDFRFFLGFLGAFVICSISGMHCKIILRITACEFHAIVHVDVYESHMSQEVAPLLAQNHSGRCCYLSSSLLGWMEVQTRTNADHFGGGCGVTWVGRDRGGA